MEKTTFRGEISLFAGAAALAVLVFLYAMVTHTGWLAVAAKPIPVLILAALLWRTRAAPSGGKAAARFRGVIGLGLLASAGGDVLLELGPEMFLFGVGAFFLAHLAYIAAFWRDQRRFRGLAALPAASWGVVYFPLLGPRLGELYLPVLVYTVALCTMLWRALARWPGRLGAALGVNAGALGALAFALSDSILAWNRFHTPFEGARFWIMATYWAGQLGIFLSAWHYQEVEDLPPAAAAAA